MPNDVWSEISGSKVADIKEAPVLPEGTYFFQVLGAGLSDSQDGDYKILTVRMQPLQEVGSIFGLDEFETTFGVPFTTVAVFKKFFFYVGQGDSEAKARVEDTKRDLKNFCEKTGVEGKTIQDLVTKLDEDAPKVGANIKHSHSKDGEQLFVNVGRNYMTEAEVYEATEVPS